LSKNRKNSPTVYANERPVKQIGDIINEARMSNSKGAGVTGGDPFFYFDETLSYVKALKKKFGEEFHIHIYLPLGLVDKSKLFVIHKWVDEVRFHPSFLIDDDKKLAKSEIDKIRMAVDIFGKRNVGIELPCLPEKKDDILNFISDVKDVIGFCNLNEFEISETNFDIVTEKYEMNEDTYSVSGSVEAGKWIIKEVEKRDWDVPVHLCTAATKDCYQYINRLLKHSILPYGKRSDEGTVVYFTVYYKDGDEEKDEIEGKIKKVTSNYYVDFEKKRILIDMKYVEKVFLKTKLAVARVEEHPTFGAEYLEFGYIGK